jgi:hypothetical protein
MSIRSEIQHLKVIFHFFQHPFTAVIPFHSLVERCLIPSQVFMCNIRGFQSCAENFHKDLLNIVVEWLTLLLCIQEVLGSNLGPETGYPDCGFSWFSSVLTGKLWDSTLKLGHDPFLPHPFQFIIHLSPLHSTLYNLSVQTSSKAHPVSYPMDTGGLSQG